MPVLTVSVRQADELHRLSYLEAAGLLRQAADGLQNAGESAVAPRDQAGIVAGRDLAVWLDQARGALDLVDVLDAGDRLTGPLIPDDLRAGVIEVLTGQVDTLVDTVAVTNGTGPIDVGARDTVALWLAIVDRHETVWQALTALDVYRADLEGRRRVDDLTARQQDDIVRLIERVNALHLELTGVCDGS